MTPVDVKLAFETGSAGLTLVSQLLSFLRQSAKEEHPLHTMSEVIAQLPAAAYALSKELVTQCEALRQAFIEHKIDINKTIEELEDDHWWWFSGKYKLVQGFLAHTQALSDIVGSNIDDFIAVARCRDRIDIVANAFADAKERKRAIDGIIRRDIPVEKILEQMVGMAAELRDGVQKFV